MYSIVIHSFPSPALESCWREFLTRVEFPAHLNAPEFFLEPYWEGSRPFAVLAVNGNGVAGVLTGVHEGKHLVSGLPSRPQVCIRKDEDTDQILDALAQGLLREGASSETQTVYSWEWTPLAAFDRSGFRMRPTGGDFVLDLKKGREQLFKELHEMRRRNVRSAERRGVEVFTATAWNEFLAYHEIYLKWCERKGIPPFSFEEEEKAFLNTAANRRLLLARLDGKIIAGTIIRFYPGGMVEFARNSSLPEFWKVRPNDLLQWRAIEWACQEGFKVYSLGAGAEYHKSYGGEMVPINSYRLDRTPFRRHDRTDDLVWKSRRALHKLPAPIENGLRSLIGKRRA